nr:alpha-isopropylmalate synthase regulatory domain-containing protein [Arthrobacter sp. H41]
MIVLLTREHGQVPAAGDAGQWGHYALTSVNTDTAEDGQFKLTATLVVNGVQQRRSSQGSGPIAALLDILGQDGVDVRVLDYTEHALSSGGNARAAAYVECAVGERVLWGIGIDANTTMAALKAVISAVNRAIRDSA